MRWSIAATLVGAAAVVAVASCTDIPTDPKVPVAIELDAPALPSIIAGDSLRDSLGVAVPLVARIFNYKDQPITGANITFVAIDTARVITVSSQTGYVMGNKVGRAFVVASAGGLQSPRDTLVVTPRPTLLSAVDPVRDSVQLRLGGDELKTLQVRLQADTGKTPGAPLAPVPSYLVQFAIVYPAGLSTTDTTQVYLANDNRRPSVIDTTSVDGGAVASRGIRLSPRTVNLSQLDSIVVRVTAYRPVPTPARRELVPGSPLLFTIRIKQPVGQ